jgi:peroxiredoxin Q/BCP
LARLRDDYDQFKSRGAEIVAVGPDHTGRFKTYWDRENLPFIGLSDPDHVVARLYKQEVNLFKLGRMPLNCIVDTSGRIRFIHYGSSMADIPDNLTFLNVIDELNAASK